MALFRRAKSVQQPVEKTSDVIEVAPQLPAGPAKDELGRRSLEDQRDYLLSLIDPLPPFGMYLLDAWGMSVCEDIIAQTNLPEQDLAAVDGYAVRSAFAIPGARVEAHEVLAGMALPGATNSVISRSEAEVANGLLTVSVPVPAGLNVRVAGSTMSEGTTLIKSGEVLDARRSGLLAGAGFDRVMARPRPRVVVLDVVDSSATSVSQRAISEVNSHLIAAALRADGAQVWRVDIPAGEDEKLRDLISDQLIRADLVVSAAGLGAEQLLNVVSEMGRVDSSKVALKPGGAIAFGLIGDDAIPMALLPYEPFAAYCAYQAFVRPIVAKLMGLPQRFPTLQLQLTKSVISTLGVSELLCARIDGEAVTPIAPSTDANLRDLADADGMIFVPQQADNLAVGKMVEVWPL